MMGSACLNTVFILPRPSPGRGRAPERRTLELQIRKLSGWGRVLGGGVSELPFLACLALPGWEPRGRIQPSPAGVCLSGEAGGWGTGARPGLALVERRLLEAKHARVSGPRRLPLTVVGTAQFRIPRALGARRERGG